MFINEALAKLKNLKSKISRVEKYISESAVYYEDSSPEYDYEVEMLTRKHLNEEILALKASIQVTNSQTQVTFKGKTISLTELILRNAGLRSELAFLAKQMEHTKEDKNAWRAVERTKDHVKKVLAKGCDKTYFKSEIDRLEKEKEELEQVMAHANSSTAIIGV